MQNECCQKLKGLLLATCIVVTLSCSTILTPLWIDSIIGQNNTLNNNSNQSFPNDKHVDSFAVVFIVNSVYLIASGIAFICFVFCTSSKYQAADVWIPKVQYILIGFSDAISTVCFVYASSGRRTAPYLQSLASNFAIPVTFLIRFLLLRKKPTLRKLCFASIVLIAEFIALIPSIFPSLEGKQSHKDDGGATGLAGILWPLCYFLGFIPQSIVSVSIEKVAKPKSEKLTKEDSFQPVVILFWTYSFCFIGLCLLFWTDIIPDFGQAKNITDFWNLFSFNILCFVGIDYCDIQAHVCSVLVIIVMLINRVLVIIFLRLSEGANYLVIIMSLQTPIVLLFWTLFIEQPFHFDPHQDLSTWLSLVAVVMMLPAIYLYNIAPSENLPQDEAEEKEPLVREDGRRGFFNKSSDSYQSIDIVATSSDDQQTYNPLTQGFTDSYQSIQSLDSSVNSFRNSFIFRYNSFNRNSSI